MPKRKRARLIPSNHWAWAGYSYRYASRLWSSDSYGFAFLGLPLTGAPADSAKKFFTVSCSEEESHLRTHIPKTCIDEGLDR